MLPLWSLHAYGQRADAHVCLRRQRAAITLTVHRSKATSKPQEYPPDDSPEEVVQQRVTSLMADLGTEVERVNSAHAAYDNFKAKTYSEAVKAERRAAQNAEGLRIKKRDLGNQMKELKKQETELAEKIKQAEAVHAPLKRKLDELEIEDRQLSRAKSVALQAFTARFAEHARSAGDLQEAAAHLKIP